MLDEMNFLTGGSASVPNDDKNPHTSKSSVSNESGKLAGDSTAKDLSERNVSLG